MTIVQSAEQKVYRAKEYLVANTGILGAGFQNRIAKTWIRSIIRKVDQKCASAVKEEWEDSATDAYRADTEWDERCSGAALRVGIIVHSLEIGGGELFPIYLANELFKDGICVRLINCNMMPEKKQVRKMICEGLPVDDLADYTEIADCVNKNHLNIVHTHHAMIDLAVSRFIENGAVRVQQVVTLHGMYEALDSGRTQMVIDQTNKTCSRYVYITDKNLSPFMERADWDEKLFIKIPNGLPSGCTCHISRGELGIPDDAFVLCLVSRARMEKGWAEAIRIVRLANRYSERDIHLILVGDGEAYDKLKDQADSNIHFTGYQQNTRQYFAISDMGFLPSKFKGESYPLVVIDSLMCGKPVIASQLGEIPQMLKTSNGSAGTVFALEDGRIPVKQMAKAIVQIAGSEELYRKMQCNVKEAACRCDIKNVSAAYQKVYCDVLAAEGSKHNVKIMISCHKPARVLRSRCLQPVQVGCALSKERFAGMLHDDVGENISEKNRSYCELTAQYWAWKNIEADYYGFFHYRRYMNLSSRDYPEDIYGNVYEPSLGWNDERRFAKKYGLTDASIRKLMKEYDVVTVKARELKEKNGKQISVRDHYAQASYLREEDLDTMIQIIHEMYPEYTKAAEEYLEGSRAYFCNMYIMKKNIFYDYCTWVFGLLDEFCNRTDLTDLDEEQLRTPGHLAERLWGIYFSCLKSEKIRVKECQYVVVSSTDPEEKQYRMILGNQIKKIVHYSVFGQRFRKR